MKRIVTPREQIQFAIDFAERDLAKVSKTNWTALVRDLRCFFDAAGSFSVSPWQTFPTRYPRNAMLSLQEEVRTILHWLVTTLREMELYTEGNVEHFRLSIARHNPISFSQRLNLTALNDELVVSVDGAIRDLFLGSLVRALQVAGKSPIGKCVCGRLFLRTNRRKYCQNSECAKARQDAYWTSYIGSARGQRARERQYEKMGWRLGARRKTRGK